MMLRLFSGSIGDKGMRVIYYTSVVRDKGMRFIYYTSVVRGSIGEEAKWITGD